MYISFRNYNYDEGPHEVQTGPEHNDFEVVSSGIRDLEPDTGKIVGTLPSYSSVYTVVSGFKTSSEYLFTQDVVDSISSVYNVNRDKVLIAYANRSSSASGTIVSCTSSGNAVTYLTPTVFNQQPTNLIETVYNSADDKVIILYQDKGNSNRGTAVVADISGDTFSFGSPVVFSSGAAYQIKSCYDPNNNKIVTSYLDEDDLYNKLTLGSVVGDTISFTASNRYAKSAISALLTEDQSSPVSYLLTEDGDKILLENSVDDHSADIVYDSTNNKVFIAYADALNNNVGTSIVATISGTFIGLGVPSTFNSTPTQFINTCFDPDTSQVITVYQGEAPSFSATAVVGNLSTTPPVFGSPEIFRTNSSNYLSTVYDTKYHRALIALNDNVYNKGEFVLSTISDLSINFDTFTTFNPATTRSISAAYVSSDSSFVITYRNVGNGSYGASVVYSYVEGVRINYDADPPTTDWLKVPPALPGYWDDYSPAPQVSSGLLSSSDGYRPVTVETIAGRKVETFMGPDYGVRDAGKYTYFGGSAPDGQFYDPYKTPGDNTGEQGSTGGGVSHGRYEGGILTNSLGPQGTANRSEWVYNPPVYCKTYTQTIRTEEPGLMSVPFRFVYRGGAARYVSNYGSIYLQLAEGVRNIYRKLG